MPEILKIQSPLHTHGRQTAGCRTEHGGLYVHGEIGCYVEMRHRGVYVGIYMQSR